jgi:hypothetical protein
MSTGHLICGSHLEKNKTKIVNGAFDLWQPSCKKTKIVNWAFKLWPI